MAVLTGWEAERERPPKDKVRFQSLAQGSDSAAPCSRRSTRTFSQLRHEIWKRRMRSARSPVWAWGTCRQGSPCPSKLSNPLLKAGLFTCSPTGQLFKIPAGAWIPRPIHTTTHPVPAPSTRELAGGWEGLKWPTGYGQGPNRACCPRCIDVPLEIYLASLWIPPAASRPLRRTF